jgi:hypothetical protein
MACGVALLLLLGVVLSAPLWIDAAAVKAKVAAFVNKATDGQARIGRVDLNHLPRPASRSQVRHFPPGRFEFEAKSASVDLDFLALYGEGPSAQSAYRLAEDPRAVAGTRAWTGFR